MRLASNGGRVWTIDAPGLVSAEAHASDPSMQARRTSREFIARLHPRGGESKNGRSRARMICSIGDFASTIRARALSDLRHVRVRGTLG
jgi:hypothetical protein